MLCCDQEISDLVSNGSDILSCKGCIFPKVEYFYSYKYRELLGNKTWPALNLL